jgi:hypothetical protein
VAEERRALLLMKIKIEEQQEEAAQRLSAREGQLAQWKVNLDGHEEDLAKREEALAETLRLKDEEVTRLVTEQTQGQEQKHKGKLRLWREITPTSSNKPRTLPGLLRLSGTSWRKRWQSWRPISRRMEKSSQRSSQRERKLSTTCRRCRSP